MFTSRGYKRTNLITKSLNVMSSLFIKKLLADDGGGDPQPPAVVPPIDVEALMARVRKEEKDKLYPEMQTLRNEKIQLTNTISTYLLKIGSLEAEIERLKKATEGTVPQKDFDELKAQKETAEKELKTLKDNPPKSEAEIRTALEAEYNVKLYRTEQLAEHKNEILPTLFDGITGKTNEEIDAAIAKAKAATEDARKFFGAPVNPPSPLKPPKTPPTVNPPATGADDDKFTLEYLASLDVNSPEYKEARKKLGLSS